ncbi:hypothetical protein KUTeg_010926 [Tegillarca granosa]|uniref:Fibrinogen C-terminal domain-containing protein n=1 Tax=Tegillarca granosa TaxID=220873 RepID=A0ABQ9F2F8_TEGGR|nr:hypothetical protein KUTeg_010926 [Tegillarca granosa]
MHCLGFHGDKTSALNKIRWQFRFSPFYESPHAVMLNITLDAESLLKNVDKRATEEYDIHLLIYICNNIIFKGGSCNAIKPIDCKDLYNKGFRDNKVYKIYPDGKTGFDVYCDMKTDGGGWTVIQRRFNGKTDFYRTWNEYKHGFGNRAEEYWLDKSKCVIFMQILKAIFRLIITNHMLLNNFRCIYDLGNDRIHLLTKLNSYQLKIDMVDFRGVKKYAKYSKFNVGSEASGYLLNIGGYSGTADKDNDAGGSNCAQTCNGAWWYNNCYYSSLNGKYMINVNNVKSMNWYQFHNSHLSLKISEMKIKRI